jgi:hypothetical protein
MSGEPGKSQSTEVYTLRGEKDKYERALRGEVDIHRLIRPATDNSPATVIDRPIARLPNEHGERQPDPRGDKYWRAEAELECLVYIGRLTTEQLLEEIQRREAAILKLGMTVVPNEVTTDGQQIERVTPNTAFL